MNKTVLKVVGSTALSLLSTFAVNEAIASRGNAKSEPDYLLILGCTVHGEEPCETLKARIRDAIVYLLDHPDVKAIPCGGIVQKDQTKAEAVVIAEALEKAGISPERILLEDKSKTTEENFLNAKKIIASQPDGATAKIAFLSSEYHLYRAGIIAKRAKVTAETIPSKTPKNELFKAYLRELVVLPMAFK